MSMKSILQLLCNAHWTIQKQHCTSGKQITHKIHFHKELFAIKIYLLWGGKGFTLNKIVHTQVTAKTKETRHTLWIMSGLQSVCHTDKCKTRWKISSGKCDKYASVITKESAGNQNLELKGYRRSAPSKQSVRFLCLKSWRQFQLTCEQPPPHK